MIYKAEIEAWPPEEGKAPKAVRVKIAPLPCHKAERQYTESDYDRLISSQFKVRVRGHWRRVYVCKSADTETAYIGLADGWSHTVNIWMEEGI